MSRAGCEHATWVEVDLDAISGNVAAALNAVDGPAVMAVVKGNGYGHGAVAVARAALAGGATWLGVARAGEAMQLRGAGIGEPILLLGHAPSERLTELITAGVSLTAWSLEQVKAIGRAVGAVRAGVPSGTGTTGSTGSTPLAHVHLKVDTGMGRLGCRPAEVLDLARAVAAAVGVRLEGLFTHLARADEPDVATTGEQLAVFAGVVGELTAAGLRPPVVHTANSAGIFTVASPRWRSGRSTGELPEAGYDLVRLGIAMYGLSPGPQVRLPDAVRPALTWKTVLAQVKQVPPGQGLSYGHTYTTSRNERIGTVPVGYADGWRRTAGNEVQVGGRRASVVGRVCMDQCLVNLDGVPDAVAGDEVVLIGAQGSERISADDVAERWGTIGYEVVCGIGSRVPRLTAGHPSPGRAQLEI